MTDGPISITSGALTARIDPFGAELVSLTDGQGREWMTDADPAFWTGHAPLLFPIVGSLAGDTLRHDGGSWTLPRHGFARKSRFEVIEASADRARFRLRDSEATRAVFPFAFVLDMAFTVADRRLVMEATVHNPGQESGSGTLPFSFGYHPAFAWPLPGGAAKAAHKVVFAGNEPEAVRRLDRASGLLLPQGEPSPVAGRELALDEALFRDDALIWTELASRSLSYGAEGGGWIDLAFADMPMLGIWQVPGAHYICLEPWQGHADPQGFAGDFADKPGVVHLDPGQSRSFVLDLTLRPA